MAVRMKNKDSDIYLEAFPFNRMKRSFLQPTEKNEIQRDIKEGFYSLFEGDGFYSVETMLLNEDTLGEVARGPVIAANKLYASGALPLHFIVDLTVSKDRDEASVRRLVTLLSETARKLGCKLSVGNAGITELSGNAVLVSVFAVGKRREGQASLLPFRQKAQLVFTGYLAEEMTAVLATRHRRELLQTLPESLVERACSFKTNRLLDVISEEAFQAGITKGVSLGSKGITAGFYELCEEWNVGIRVDMNRIPVHQESIEVFELLQQNPYELPSNGNMLIVTEDASGLKERLEKRGIPSQTIGTLDKNMKTKELIWGNRIRYLDRP